MQNINPENLKRHIFFNLGGDVRLLDASPEEMVRANLNAIESGAKTKWSDQMKDTLAKYASQSENARKVLNELTAFHEKYISAPAITKGPIFSRFSSLNPDTQVALKNQAKMILDRTQGYKGMSRILLKDLELLEKGGLNVKLSPEAEDYIYNFSKNESLRDMENSQLANNLSTYITNPFLVDEVVQKANEFYNYMDENGEFHPDNIFKIKNYDTPYAAIAIGTGNQFLPENYDDVVSFLVSLPENKGKSKKVVAQEIIDKSTAKDIPPSLGFEKLRTIINGMKNAKR